MEEAKKNLFKNALGIAPQTRANSIADVIGGALFGAGLISAFAVPETDYAKATKGVQLQAGAILPNRIAENDKTEAGVMADMAGYEQGALNKAQAGLEARGIGDTAVSRETAANVKSGLSGAYAAAHSALARAKLNSQMGLSSAMAKYNMDLVEKQYASQMANYAAKMGLWGALGGGSMGLMGMPSTEKEATPISMSSKLNLSGKPGVI